VYNTSPKERDGLSPFFALYGRDAHLPGEMFRGLDEFDYTNNRLSDYIHEIRYRLKDAHNYMRERLDAAALTNVEHQKKLASYPIHRVGDTVWLRATRGHGIKPTLFVRRYNGPFIVRARVGQVNYEISRPDKPGVTQLVHVDDLKKSQAAAEDDALHEQVPIPQPSQVGYGYDARARDLPAPQAPLPPVTAAAASSTAPSISDGQPLPRRESRRTRQARLTAQEIPTTADVMSDINNEPHAPSPLPGPTPDPRPQQPSTHPMRTRVRDTGLRVNLSEQAQEQLALMSEYTNLYKPGQVRVASRHPSKFTAAMIQALQAAGAGLKKKVVS